MPGSHACPPTPRRTQVEAEEVDAATIHFEVATVPTFVFFKVCS